MRLELELEDQLIKKSRSIFDSFLFTYKQDIHLNLKESYQPC